MEERRREEEIRIELTVEVDRYDQPGNERSDGGERKPALVITHTMHPLFLVVHSKYYI